MITYLLHGGKTSVESPGNDFFFGEFTKLVDKPTVNIMLCYWARTREKWKSRSEWDSKIIQQNTTKKTNIHMVETPLELFETIDRYDVLYISGGEAYLLEPYYPKLKELKDKLQGKLFAGSSMGVFMASSHYVLSLDGQDERTVHAGLGLLPVQTLCHWNAETDKDQKLKLLLQNNIPILTLNEFEYVTIYTK